TDSAQQLAFKSCPPCPAPTYSVTLSLHDALPIYDFEVALSGGRIVGADYEVDDEWLDRLGCSPVTADEAKAILKNKAPGVEAGEDRKSTRLNSSHVSISYAVFCLT